MLVSGAGKRFLYLHYRDIYRGPKIVINHGSNMADGMSSEILAELLGDAYMVCNSETARRLWNYPKSRYIRHGMSVEEWPLTHYGNHNILIIQPYSRRKKNKNVTEEKTIFEF